MTTFPNPELRELYQRDLGTIWEAAREAGVKPGTIRVWESRGKIERIQGLGDETPLYHLPTVKAAGQCEKSKFRTRNPALSSRGPHRRAA